MSRKVDLGNLLAKYEGSGQIHRAECSPARTNELKVSYYEQDYTYQAPEIVVSSAPITGQFQMSKSECQQFLMRVREELRKEERALENFAEISMREIHAKFHANHERIKRQILDLLEKAFHDNERYITEQLKRQNNAQPQEFMPVHKKITEIDQDLNRLLFGLKSSDYRRSIAEVVMKDYYSELTSLKEGVRVAKEAYLSTLGEVEPDRARIDCIRQDLQKLFRISKKNAALVENAFFSVLGSKFKQNQRPQSNMKNSTVSGGFLLSPTQRNTTNAENSTNQNPPQRRTMFNFGLFE